MDVDWGSGDSTMDIYSKEGTMVQFANPNAGYEGNQRLAKNYLKVRNCYTVDYTDVSSSHTSVYFKEFPGVGFNSVHFRDIPQMPK